MALEIVALVAVLAPIGSAVVAHVWRQRASLAAAREFFRAKRCAICDAPIAEPRLAAHAPALRGPEGGSVEWTDLSAEELEAMADTHVPVCWNCHVAEEFRRRYPERVTDRRVP